ncbi:MAG: hypothetical protein PHW96_00160 [Candidatus Nanoarchaeia archaeon]|nr:hypothetical protein [Candidatus Nanoarchaeia archaeon]
MNEIIRNDILDVLKQAVVLVKKGDSESVKSLSNRTIHNASTFQDSHSITWAVLIYSLAKIMESNIGNKTAKWIKFRDKIISLLEKMTSSLKHKDYTSYEYAQKTALDVISKYDKKYSLYVRWILEKAKIKKATRIYEHGISLGRVAELLGVSKYEIMDYLGATKIHEKQSGVKEPSSRLKIANKLFRRDDKNE